ncbi:MAG: hypothetical protein IT173_11040 [Acidobacteria bacterium]|nr:hypothetical protein [Acidobacteriota bacterium]
MSWFDRLVGFQESNPEQVRENLVLDGTRITSLVNGRVMNCGTLEIPSLAELREQVRSTAPVSSKVSLREVVGNVREMHGEPQKANALFQVASQFSLLEMTSPHVTPEKGIGIYEHDPTQGPACAIAAGAGTIYRNYFVPVNGRVGQTSDNQLDCLKDLGSLLGNDGDRLWRMSNGYVQATSAAALEEIFEKIHSISDVDLLCESLRIGIQSDTEVTDENVGHRVTQAFCSGLPLGGYTNFSSDLWEPFARLVLEACYEATICAAILNASNTGSNKVYLTLVGGGVFGNDPSWIVDAIDRALSKYADYGLDVAIVSYRSPNPALTGLLDKYD